MQTLSAVATFVAFLGGILYFARVVLVLGDEAVAYVKQRLARRRSLHHVFTLDHQRPRR